MIRSAPMTWLMRGLSALVLVATFALAALAQEADPEGQGDWPALRDRAETALASEEVSVDALSTLRAALVEQRSVFEERMNEGSGRIASVRAQIDALGAPPAEGEEEPPEIAEERAVLDARLEELLAPVRVSQVAFAEVDGLISETDRRIEAASAERTLRKAPVPINPIHWGPAASELTGWLAALGRDLWQPFSSPTARAAWMSRGIELGVLVLLSIVLIWRSGVWLGRLRDRVAPREGESPGVRVVLMAISLARLVLPIVGLGVVARIVDLMGTEGLRIDVFTDLLPAVGVIVFSTRWLALQALPRRETAPAFLDIGFQGRAEARWHALILGVLLAAALVIEEIAPQTSRPEVLRSVALFVLLVLGGLNVVRLGQIFLAEGRTDGESESEGFWPQVLRLLGRALMVVGIISPLVAALGYVNLGNAVLWPAVLSLGLVMLIGIAQSLVFDLYAVASRRTDTGRDALLPTLIGFMLALAAAPFLALIWGVRPSTLAEWWASFMRGFSVGGTEISPANFLTFAIVFVIGFLVVRLIKGVLRTNILPKTRMDSGASNAVLSGTGYVGITLAALIAITAAGIDLSGLAIVAGALSVGIGFGLQTIVQNFVSGIILLVERPIKIGDWVKVGAIEGFVQQISVRSTRIETFDRQDVILPNADLISGVVTNYTLRNNSGRVVVTVGVAYGSDTRRVQKILEEVAEAHPMVILNPAPLVTFDGFGADSLDFTVRVVVRDILFKVIVASELNHAIAERFAEEGLEIPFAQRDLWLRNPETLREATHAPDPESP
ncbi:mechanosensitive ion channel family protein [Jannaschia marina]|uniref:mechanosensitive ion channel family protein n=1 Tax=Jannaschia marina TaxID=2741674 RepID=UPI0015C8AD6B|nr:mechanosensitive ion channel domain-containing protein [Jannaschia marina]